MTEIPHRELEWHTRLSTLTDRDVLALVLWGEARGEPIAGQVAVGCVIRNRVNAAHFGLGYKGVILRSQQFSCFYEPDSPNTLRVVQLADEWQAADDYPARAGMQVWVADGILSGKVPDVTKGADHYLTIDLYQSPKCPRWASKMAITATVAHHVFLKEHEVVAALVTGPTRHTGVEVRS